ncbi:glucose 1-dehydrogenase [Candidatus Curtissbacteria bacterium]|nr:glucose 1-dehydrogenase [Candidatus Curtissbacteria bacterium]
MQSGKKEDPKRELFSLKDKSAVVTGASSGIGRAIVQLFAERGASVLVADINEVGGRETVDLITEAGGQAFFCQTDVSKLDKAKNMANIAESRFGKVDILVNNAAAFVFGSIEEVTQENWQRVLGVNVIGYANCVQQLLPLMKERGGSIINIASVSSFIAQPDFVPYNTSKGAVLQLTRTLAMDLAKYQIRVNSICPGSIKTPAADNHIRSLGLDLEAGYRQFGEQSLLKRMGEPKEIAMGALFLASEESSFVTGSQFVMDGGATID